MIFMLLGLLWKEQWDSRKSSLGLSSWPTTGTIFLLIIQGGTKKGLWCIPEEKCLWNSEIFFDGVFLSIYSHLLKKLELSKLFRKKVIGL